MKALRSLCAVLLGATSSLLIAQTRTTLPIDAAASKITWTGHAEVGTYAPSGTLAVRSGDITFRDGQFSGATLVIDMQSMQQSNEQLLHHLKSPDFFDVERFPVSNLKLDSASGGKVHGTLTIRDKTTPIESPVEVRITPGHVIVSGTITLDRTKYGIVYNSNNFFSGLGDKAIRNTFEVEFTLTGIGDLPKGFRF